MEGLSGFILYLTSDCNPNKASRISNLSNHFSTRYQRGGKPEDLTQVIKHSQEAINLISDSTTDRAGYLYSRSNHLSTRYESDGKLKQLAQAIVWGRQHRAASTAHCHSDYVAASLQWICSTTIEFSSLVI